MNTTPTRIGQINGSGDELALFLKVFSGEVLTQFETATKFKPLHRTRTITHGKSAQFPVVGNANAKRHVAGEDILDPSKGYLSQIAMAERTIHVDDPLIAATFVASIDEMISHFDVRAPFATELGRKLAYEYDKHVAQTIVLAARDSSAVNGGKNGTVINAGPSVVTDVDVLVAAIQDAGAELDKKDVPDEGRWLALRPDEYWLLINSDKAINRDFGGDGTFAEGKIWTLAGFNIIKSNHLPSTDMSGLYDPGARNNYYADFSNTVALAFTEAAVGTVALQDITTEAEYKIENQGHLMLAKYVCGHGILRPECAVEITKAP